MKTYIQIQESERHPKKKPRVTVTAVLLDKFQDNVPKGKTRKMLEVSGRFRRLFVSRCDDHGAVDTKIRNLFGVEQYLFLECVKGGNKLIVSSNQQMNGSEVIVRRGCLYLCKVSSQDSTSTTIQRPVDSSDDDNALLPPPLRHHSTTVEMPIVISDGSSSDWTADVNVASSSTRVIEYEQRKHLTERQEEATVEQCQICKTSKPDCVILPCGHAGICKPCADTVAESSAKFPFCRQAISSIHRIYL